MGFTWQSPAHAFASLLKGVVTVSKKVATALQDVEDEAPKIEAVTSLISPQVGAIEQIAFGALGTLIAAVHSGGEAAGANGLNVSFDESVIAEVKELIAEFPEIIAEVEAVFGKANKKPALTTEHA